MTAGFDVTSLQQRYAFIDACPPALFPSVIALPLGALPDRVMGICRWRDALLAGRVPSGESWPPPAVADPVRRALLDLGIARFCKEQPELVDALLADVLSAFARQNETFHADLLDRLRELEALARRSETSRDGRGRARKKKPTHIDRIRAQAEAEVAARVRAADPDILATWGDRVRAWAEIADVFGDLGAIMGRGWDPARGVLRHTGWREILRLRELVSQLPQAREVVRALGRLHASVDDTTLAEVILGPVRRLEQERRETRVPHALTEVRGVERSGEITRMLPVEAAMLGHPKLRTLWHARRAERALLCYRAEGVDTELVRVEHETSSREINRAPRLERGPIVAVVDTSGSMHGLPEQVAKALTLEAVRVAHLERRRCLLFAYGGPGEVVELELDLTPEGVGRLLDFLGRSFGGGTDIAVMSRVLERLETDEWTKADVILMSDGEWPAPRQIVGAVQRAKDRGTRFHGVQIGNHGETGLHAICDPVHAFSEWAALGG
jgi:uncharacterized protein with von Willebrand factor type A (vWA) domain